MAKRRKRTKTKRTRMAKSRKMARSRTKKLRKKNKRGGAGGESAQAQAEFEHLLIKLLLTSMGYNENGEHSGWKDDTTQRKKLNITKSELNKYIPMNIHNLGLLIKFAEEKNTEIQSKTESEISLSELNFQPIPGSPLSKFRVKRETIESWMNNLIKKLKQIYKEKSGIDYSIATAAALLAADDDDDDAL